MKVCCQLPISMPRKIYGSYYDLLMEAYRLFKDARTDIRIKDVPSGLTDPELIRYYGFRALNDAEIAKAMIIAESEGFDAIAGACYFDSGIKTASSIVSIPVVGAAESAMHLAAMMGNKFAVITSEPAWVMEMEHHLIQQGFGGHAITHKPVRSLTLAMPVLFADLMRGDVSAVIENFTGVAECCLDDGADVLIAGCGLISPVFTVKGICEISGAPIIDPMIASLKTAEMMANLSMAGMRVKSGRGLYEQATQEIRRKGLLDLNVIT